MTDPISDMLTRMRNALSNGQAFVIVPSSKFKTKILEVIKKSGYIEEFKEVGEEKGPKYLKIKFRYNVAGKPVITGLKKVSKPGRRVYVTQNNLPIVLSGIGIAVISTSAGMMTNIEAKKKNVGGEYICDIY